MTNINDPALQSPDYYIAFTDRSFNRHIYDYRFNYELQTDGSGRLGVFADATTSYEMMKAYAQSYYPQYYQGQTYSKYYEKVLESLKAGQNQTGTGNAYGSYAGLSEADLRAAAVSILDGKRDQLPAVILNSQAYNVTYAGVLKNSIYHNTLDKDGNVISKGLITTEAEAETERALRDETIHVTIGTPDDVTYKIYTAPTEAPYNGQYKATIKASDLIHTTYKQLSSGGYELL